LQESCAAAAVETEAFLSGSESARVSPRAEEAAGIAGSEDAAPAPEAIAAAEVALIEIWRPQRQHHNQRRDHNRQRPNQRHDLRAGNGREAATGASEAETSQGGGRNQARQGGPPRRNFKLPLQARVSAEAQASSEPSAPVASETIAAQPREDRKDQRRDGPAADSKPRQGRRNDERRDRRQGSFGNSEKPASRERQPDPNSPFAKLLILKQQWENQSNKT
jgi:ATP-dependent RNA helicase SUPV3L1/SUV3